MAENADAWRLVDVSGPGIVAAAAAVTWLLTLLAYPVLRKIALVKPNARSSHREVTPQGGGAVVVAVTLLMASALAAATPILAPGDGSRLAVVLGAAAALAVVGALDDLRELGSVPRLIAQAIAVAAVLWAVPSHYSILPAELFWLERALLFVAGIWFVNLVNFMDGIDWMMVAEVVPVSLGIVLVGLAGRMPSEATVVALALMGAMAGFAPFNRPVARLFLGDVGSLPIGLLLGWLLVLVAASGHVAAALLLPLYFVADATLTLLRRMRQGERIWEAHRTHFYQRARDAGWSNMEIVSRVAAVNMMLVALAVLSVVVPGWLSGVAMMLAGAALVTWLLAILVRGPA
jgi:UDP-N-acetylmuramyl pentapeptide phosphotransferase/UDP-N-acetylglucosamine-1-phosphate transferase